MQPISTSLKVLADDRVAVVEFHAILSAEQYDELNEVVRQARDIATLARSVKVMAVRWELAATVTPNT